MKHKLTINGSTEIEFDGTPLLADVLLSAGFDAQKPCGGHGRCGKCAVVKIEGAISEPNAAELRAGRRLACQTLLLGDASVTLNEAPEIARIALDGISQPVPLKPMSGEIGAAIDVGTTTVALTLYDLRTGKRIRSSGIRNPQTRIAADVMGRIGAALDGSGEILKKQIIDAIEALLDGAKPDSLVITGNTTMLYLLTGRSPKLLARAPFRADCLFDLEETLFGGRAYLPPCMNAFVGADIACAALACGMCRKNETALLCDIGTNGEIALWKENTLYVTSTAAGPAFEGAGISCGCAGIAGAIDRVWVENGKICAHIIGEPEQMNRRISAQKSGICAHDIGVKEKLSDGICAHDIGIKEELSDGICAHDIGEPEQTNRRISAQESGICAHIIGVKEGLSDGIFAHTIGVKEGLSDGIFAHGIGIKEGLSDGICAHTIGKPEQMNRRVYERIGEERAVGICGSGLIDAVAALLQTEAIDETGATDFPRMEIRGGAALLPADIRAVQLAKAAVAAGIETLLETAHVSVSEIGTLYIAGGFGSALNPESAARIGLIPSALKSRVQPIGNAALAGASMLLLNRDSVGEIREIAAEAYHINLGGNPLFNESYIEQMLFPEQD